MGERGSRQHKDGRTIFCRFRICELLTLLPPGLRDFLRDKVKFSVIEYMRVLCVVGRSVNSGGALFDLTETESLRKSVEKRTF